MKYLDEFESIFKTALDHVSVDQLDTFWLPDRRSKAVLILIRICQVFNYFGPSTLWPMWQIWLCDMATAANLVMRYGPLHCGKFGFALLATVVDLVMRYEPLRGMKHNSKILRQFLCCPAQDLIMRYGLQRKIL